MADGYIDLGPIIRAVDRSISSLSSDMEKGFNSVGNYIRYVDDGVQKIKTDLTKLKQDFVNMVLENRKQAALQRALIEIVRVRQELERDYGNYKNVRATMLGILESTDTKLVRQSTISTCTEELMISTPRYWLAPVLVALSAWLADNKPLATRALQEALNRDEEKTCLTFALICRRNKRTSACFEWLSRYFSMQKAEDMKESIIAYIDAYTNGVFGEDRDNMCEEYIQSWMNQLEHDDANFAEKQKAYWKHTYELRCKDTTATYPQLAKCSAPEFAKMNEYIKRINAAPGIVEFFNKIITMPVDRLSLVRAIDNELIKLVKNYDKEEAPLREEEAYLTDIKESKGDEKYANAKKRLRELGKIDNKVNLATRLSQTVMSNKTEDISAKKTAIRFMAPYIKESFKEFIEEKASAFPKEIDVKVDDWSGKSKDAKNTKELSESYTTHQNNKREAELANVKDTAAKGTLITGLIFMVAAIALIACAFAMSMGVLHIGWVFAAIGIVCLFVSANKFKKNKRLRAGINATYDKLISDGQTIISNAIKQYAAVISLVAKFDPIGCYNTLLITEGK